MKKFIFLDFETSDLDGFVKEAYAIDQDGKKISELGGEVKTVEDFFEEVRESSVEQKYIVFWHHYMPEYLAEHHKKIYEDLCGRFICLNSVYLFYTDLEIKSIAEITKKLLGKDHLGKAKDDAEDLKACFDKMTEIAKIKRD